MTRWFSRPVSWPVNFHNQFHEQFPDRSIFTTSFQTGRISQPVSWQVSWVVSGPVNFHDWFHDGSSFLTPFPINFTTSFPTSQFWRLVSFQAWVNTFFSILALAKYCAILHIMQFVPFVHNSCLNYRWRWCQVVKSPPFCCNVHSNFCRLQIDTSRLDTGVWFFPCQKLRDSAPQETVWAWHKLLERPWIDLAGAPYLSKAARPIRKAKKWD